MNLEPLGPDAVTEEAFLKVERVLVLLCVVFQTLSGAFVVPVFIETRRFIHVVLAEVHPVGLRMEHVQLDLFDPAENEETLIVILKQKIDINISKDLGNKN